MDLDGAWTEFSNPNKLTIDTQKPSSSLTNPKNNGFYNSLNMLSGIATDSIDGSGLNKVDFMYPENMDMEKRRLVTQDVNSAIEGALEGGARTIFVNDTHPPERTIIIEELNPAAQLIPNGLSFFTLQDIDETFDDEFQDKLVTNAPYQYPDLSMKFNPGSRLQAFGIAVPINKFTLAAAYYNQFEMKMNLLFSGLRIYMRDNEEDPLRATTLRISADFGVISIFILRQFRLALLISR